MEGFKEDFIQREWKDLERLVLQVVSDKMFLHKKINNRDVYVNLSFYRRYARRYMEFKVTWRFDSIELN